VFAFPPPLENPASENDKDCKADDKRATQILSAVEEEDAKDDERKTKTDENEDEKMSET
jgi:hypothetical protein